MIVMKAAPKLVLSGHQIAGYLNVIADSLEPKLRMAYLDAVEASLPQVTVVAEAIRAGQSPFTPDVELAIQSVSIPMAPLHAIALQSYAVGGAVGHKMANPTFKMSFDLKNPRTQAWSNAHAGALVKYVSDPARDAIRQAITTGYQTGWTVDQTARFIKDHNIVGLLPKHAGAVVKYQQGLVTSGVPPQKISSLVSRYTNKLLNYRAMNIARTEILGAANAGQMDYWRSAIDAGFLASDTQRTWVTAADEKLCPVCRSLEGTTSGMEGLFYPAAGGSGFYQPPAHPSCRCSMSLVISLAHASYTQTAQADVPAVTGYPTGDLDAPMDAGPNHFIDGLLSSLGTKAATDAAVDAGTALGLADVATAPLLETVEDALSYIGVAGLPVHEQIGAVEGFLAEYGDQLPEHVYTGLLGLVGLDTVTKFNQNHEPAGSAQGGQFASGKGNGGGPIEVGGANRDEIDQKMGFGEWDGKKTWRDDKTGEPNGYDGWEIQDGMYQETQHWKAWEGDVLPHRVITTERRRVMPDQVTDHGPVQYVGRVVSEADYQRMKAQGFLNSDGRGNIGANEGLVTSVERSAWSYLGDIGGSKGHDNPTGTGRLLKIRVHREDGWHLDGADSYLKTNAPVPFDRIEMVSKPVKVTRTIIDDSGSFNTEMEFTKRKRWWYRLTKFNQNHQPAGSDHGGEFAPSEGGGYRGLHQPNSDGPPASNLLQDLGDGPMFPDDVYDHPEWYTGYTDKEFIGETMKTIRSARGNPDKLITVYRGAPPGLHSVNHGDWITLSRSYARQHGYDATDPSKDWPVYSAQVRAGDVRFAGDDLMEFGYWGPDVGIADEDILKSYARHDLRMRLLTEMKTD